MTFEVGETVVYPHHGAARIIDIRQRKVRGEEKTYLQLEVAQGGSDNPRPRGERGAHRSAGCGGRRRS